MIIDIVRHTPVWVFGILVALVVLGVRQLRPCDLTARQLVVLPGAMALLSLVGLYQSFGPNAIAAGSWLVALVFALLVGRALAPQDGVQYSPASRRVRIPGSWMPLALMMTIFLLRYSAAVSLALHRSLRTDVPFIALVGAACGLSSGCLAARALRYRNSAFPRTSRIVATVSA